MPNLSNSSGGNGGAFDPGEIVTVAQAGTFSAGDDISNLSALEFLRAAFASPAPAIFAAFNISGTKVVKVGSTISGNRDFSFALVNSVSVSENTVNILDVTNNQLLAENQAANSSPLTVELPPITKNTKGSHVFKALATTTANAAIESSPVAINWHFERFYGFLPTKTPSNAQIIGLSTDFTESPVLTQTTLNNSEGSQYPTIFIRESDIPGTGDYNTRLSVYVGGIDNTLAWEFSQVNVTNSEGVTENYVQIILSTPTAANTINVETRLA
jgi:hypothetical protein